MFQGLFFFQLRRGLVQLAHVLPAFQRGQIFLADPDIGRRQLDQFVVVDEFQCFFQRHDLRRNQLHRFIVAGGTNGRHLLVFQRIDVHVHIPGRHPDDHAFVDLGLRGYKQLAAFLDIPQRVGHACRFP